eukprot:scaffold10785_cov114-Isochrysis_galbana.AAC.8
MASGEPAVERKGSEKDEEERKEEDLSTRPSHPPQPCMYVPEMIGRAPGEMVKGGGGGRGGNASLPGDSKVSRRIRPLALLILV